MRGPPSSFVMFIVKLNAFVDGMYCGVDDSLSVQEPGSPLAASADDAGDAGRRDAFRKVRCVDGHRMAALCVCLNTFFIKRWQSFQSPLFVFVFFFSKLFSCFLRPRARSSQQTKAARLINKTTSSRSTHEQNAHGNSATFRASIRVGQ